MLIDTRSTTSVTSHYLAINTNTHTYTNDSGYYMLKFILLEYKALLYYITFCVVISFPIYIFISLTPVLKQEHLFKTVHLESRCALKLMEV